MKPINHKIDTCNKQSADCIILETPLDCLGICGNTNLTDVIGILGNNICSINQQLSLNKLDFKCLVKNSECKPLTFNIFLQLIIDKLCSLENANGNIQQKTDEICKELAKCKVTITNCEFFRVENMPIYDPANPQNSLLHYIFSALCKLQGSINGITIQINTINQQIRDIWTYLNNLSSTLPTYPPVTITGCPEFINATTLNNFNGLNNYINTLTQKICCIRTFVGLADSTVCTTSFASISCPLIGPPISLGSSLHSSVSGILSFITQLCTYLNTLQQKVDSNIASISAINTKQKACCDCPKTDLTIHFIKKPDNIYEYYIIFPKDTLFDITGFTINTPTVYLLKTSPSPSWDTSAISLSLNNNPRSINNYVSVGLFLINSPFLNNTTIGQYDDNGAAFVEIPAIVSFTLNDPVGGLPYTTSCLYTFRGQVNLEHIKKGIATEFNITNR